MDAIIYVRGHKQETQEIFCRLYAKEKGYKVKFVTTDINAVADCDVLLVANHSRISRNRIEYQIIVNKLKKMGIEIESAIEHEKADELLSFTMDILR